LTYIGEESSFAVGIGCSRLEASIELGKQIKVAVLMTSFNRRETTLSCLGALEGAVAESDVNPIIVLVDDGSTDGTGAAVLKQFGNVHLINGTGDLFWNRGMRRAWIYACQFDPDLFLWLNDDLLLLPKSITRLVAFWKEQMRRFDGRLIVVGRTVDPSTGKTTYGGYVRRPGLSRLHFDRPSVDGMMCDTMNGNCVLIPSIATSIIGMNSSFYTHAFGGSNRRVAVLLPDAWRGNVAAKLCLAIFENDIYLVFRCASITERCRGGAQESTLARINQQAYGIRRTWRSPCGIHGVARWHAER
jgi:glycosyltransferase involved in cell wall biosynthesis